MTEIRNLTRNGETFYPLTHEEAVIGMDEFKETIINQVAQYKPIEITGDVTNAPDEEDITSDSNNLLKFKNRNNLYGLGKVILRRGSSFASQVTLQNTIYVIQYNFDLGDARINIPNGAILLFEGGSLSNGTLVCADQCDVRLVYYQDISIILNSVTLEGNFIHKACDKVVIGTTSGTAADGGTASAHYSNTSNPHSVTKAQVGLGDVVNTGDSATPVSGGTTKFTTGGAYTELNKKVDKTDLANEKLGNGIGTCSTSSGTALVVTLSGYNLVENGFVAVTFANDVPANATLNINNKGAKPIYYKGAAITADTIKAGDTIMFSYDGTNYVVTSLGGSATFTQVSGKSYYKLNI